MLGCTCLLVVALAVVIVIVFLQKILVDWFSVNLAGPGEPGFVGDENLGN